MSVCVYVYLYFSFALTLSLSHTLHPSLFCLLSRRDSVPPCLNRFIFRSALGFKLLPIFPPRNDGHGTGCAPVLNVRLPLGMLSFANHPPHDLPIRANRGRGNGHDEQQQ